MNYVPPRPSGQSRFALFVQALWDLVWGTESIFVDTPGGALQFTKQNNGKYLPALKTFGAGAGAGGWDFANPREYDPATAYAPRKVVIVSPTNAAHTAGINNGIALTTGGAIVGADGFGPNGDRATAGWFVCVKNPKVLHETQPEDDEAPRNYTVHVPVWPLPNVDPDHAANYWMLIGFYPITVSICLSGVDTPHFIQAQPVPEEYLLGEGGEAQTGEGGEGMTSESP